mgnify:CR=1 FL=1
MDFPHRGRVLSMLRKLGGMSTKELAESLNYSDIYIVKVECGALAGSDKFWFEVFLTYHITASDIDEFIRETKKMHASTFVHKMFHAMLDRWGCE